jgi:hypothetical protein
MADRRGNESPHGVGDGRHPDTGPAGLARALDVRLTAEDGYSTQRSYSIASASNGRGLDLTVQRTPGGEVSPYLVDELVVGDQLELRGSVGGWCVSPARRRNGVLGHPAGTPNGRWRRAVGFPTTGHGSPATGLDGTKTPSDALQGCPGTPASA